ncbi:hypothetical protein B0H14DRAFT_279120 [Mycena olivaceomarginata]|nr:hypothetical protein B0H14DRAFT_279120 [Mycena olivaceomarginata]
MRQSMHCRGVCRHHLLFWTASASPLLRRYMCGRVPAFPTSCALVYAHTCRTPAYFAHRHGRLSTHQPQPHNMLLCSCELGDLARARSPPHLLSTLAYAQHTPPPPALFKATAAERPPHLPHGPLPHHHRMLEAVPVHQLDLESVDLIDCPLAHASLCALRIAHSGVCGLGIPTSRARQPCSSPTAFLAAVAAAAVVPCPIATALSARLPPHCVAVPVVRSPLHRLPHVPSHPCAARGSPWLLSPSPSACVPTARYPSHRPAPVCAPATSSLRRFLRVRCTHVLPRPRVSAGADTLCTPPPLGSRHPATSPPHRAALMSPCPSRSIPAASLRSLRSLVCASAPPPCPVSVLRRHVRTHARPILRPLPPRSRAHAAGTQHCGGAHLRCGAPHLRCGAHPVPCPHRCIAALCPHRVRRPQRVRANPRCSRPRSRLCCLPAHPFRFISIPQLHRHRVVVPRLRPHRRAPTSPQWHSSHV